MRITNVRSLVAAGLLLCCSRAVAQGAAAQQPGAAPLKRTEVRVIGCLVRVENGAWRPGAFVSGASKSAQTLPPSGFVLKDAALATAPAGSSGPVATKSEREFQLVKTDVPLKDFAGQQVEVKGRLASGGGSHGPADLSPTSTGTGASSSDQQSQAAETAGSYQNVLQVTSLRSLSASCPPQGGR
jgi:hypothetical protein